MVALVSVRAEVMRYASSRGYRLSDVRVEHDEMSHDASVIYRCDDGRSGRFRVPNSESRFSVYASEFPRTDGTVFVRGLKSEIARELSELAQTEAVSRGEQMPDVGARYLFCAGLIRQKRIAEQTEDEIAETMMVNATSVIRECDRLLEVNPFARICVIGSESAFKGSFDGAYAAAKSALHSYVETKRLNYPGQQLVCVAPTCIENTGMNRQRNEDGVAALERRRMLHPKGRWLQPIEVARMVHFLLCVDEGYTTNVVVRMNGGEHAR